jgi:hypothetical protein
MTWDYEQQILFTGDESGQIVSWNFAKFFQQNEIFPVKSKGVNYFLFYYFIYSNYIVDSPHSITKF